ncbi:MAG: tRNA (adenosine(37)-N6)-threonylcarbamoyltransferase complex ATPase subunit type 1 TsaE [Nocardioides sp.]|uniref:tRNA (adenosine(37)-N6)-threonylcarbamoyltransferase complex ATPase subunit type 1 TsaE n=1 Tax=Nocardioides sp. TaxID=35761 RepID=UPI0039E562AF
MTVGVRRVGPEAADAVWHVVHAAFAARPPLHPPAEALAETPATLAAALEGAGGLLAEIDGEPVGALVLDADPSGEVVFLRRFGVLPSHQHHGIAQVLVSAACDACPDATELRILARQEFPGTIGFWLNAGFVEVGQQVPYLEMRRPLVTSYDVADAVAMRDLGVELAANLRHGDLVVLSGELGAGKTTLTQGIGTGLGVRGEVTSPTFVIARVHPSLAEGPSLVHVDAYRLGGLAELDDLDLDTSLDDAVTVVEWGEGLAETLSDSHLDVRIERVQGLLTGLGDDGLDPRIVRVRPRGPRWTRGTSQ